jgi:hypothetical protein
LDPAPGRPNEYFFLMLGPVHINEAGDVQLRSHLVDATVTGAYSQHLGDWLWSPNGMRKLAYINERTPQLGHYFQPIGSEINEAGLQIRGARTQPVNGILPRNESLWLLGPDAAPSLMAKVGDPAPGFPSGVTLATEFAGRFLESGEILLRMGLAGPGVNDDNNLAYWLDDGQGPRRLIVREGAQAPGLPTGVVPELTTYSFVQESASGDLLVTALLRGPGINNNNNVALWTYHDGRLELLAREGDQAPGLPSGVVFERLGSKVRGPGIDDTNDMGVWIERNGFELVVREGERAPGTPDGVVFASMELFDSDYLVPPGDVVVQNNAGQFGLTAFLRGPDVTSANDVGLWAADRRGALQLIARKGQTLDVDDGPASDLRTIADIDIQNFDALSEFLNARGQVLFMATFTDGSKGLFLSDQVAVPEPAAAVGLAQLATAALCLSGAAVGWRGSRRA